MGQTMRILILVGLMLSTCAGELPITFIRALHQVESQGGLGAIKGDQGRALGPLQIHYEYWLDSGASGHYQDCANLNYAIYVVRSYLNRYAPEAVKSKNYEVLARVHNGGPGGHRRKSTLDYWRRVKQYI
jgi:hypothetical protein